MLGCMHALLLVGANPHQLDERTTLQWAEVKGQPTTAQLFRQHAASPPPATASPAAPPDAGEPVGSSPASLPAGLFYSTGRGELQQVVKWLDKWLGTGGSVDALLICSFAEEFDFAEFARDADPKSVMSGNLRRRRGVF